MSGIEQMRPVLPLIRHFSRRLTPLLLRTPISANQVSVLAMACGLVACWVLLPGGYEQGISASLWLFAYYILDHCDGEVARARGQNSRFGHELDTFVDWGVHTAFFIALGMGHAAETDQRLWFWLGVAAGAGGTINYVLVTLRNARERHRKFATAETDTGADGYEEKPSTPLQWFTFAFRELSRADFWLLVLILAAIDGLWILLPAGAIGAQIYWVLQFVSGARKYHT